MDATPQARADPATPAPGGEAMIAIDALTRRFGDKVALHPLTLQIGSRDARTGSVIGLLGPNGSGKSTLMRLLTGLVRPDAGGATVAGEILRGDGIAIRRKVTYAPGELHLYGEMRAHELLRWLLRGRDAAALARGTAMCADFGLPLRARLREYSSGMKRQLVFAAAMAPDVCLRLLDEPTAGLDPSKRGEVLACLAADVERGTTILLSSHHLGEVDRACQRLLFMNEGRLIADETSDDVHRRARRLVHLGFGADTDTAAVAAALAGPGVESTQAEPRRVAVVLTEPDPRAFLASLAQREGVPAPASIEYGKLSLAELYRSLYGVEAA